MEKGLQPSALAGTQGSWGCVCLYRECLAVAPAPHPCDSHICSLFCCLLTWLQVSLKECQLQGFACALSLGLLGSSCPAQTEHNPVLCHWLRAVTEALLGAGDG